MAEHPITPPTELLHQWATEYWGNPGNSIGESEKYVAIQAARWGADQELDACIKTFEDIWDNEDVVTLGDVLRVLCAARRPKSPSLKKQALEQLDGIATCFRCTHIGDIVCDKIRAALEQLDD